jgi:hypothetical protein
LSILRGGVFAESGLLAAGDNGKKKHGGFQLAGWRGVYRAALPDDVYLHDVRLKQGCPKKNYITKLF